MNLNDFVGDPVYASDDDSERIRAMKEICSNGGTLSESIRDGIPECLSVLLLRCIDILSTGDVVGISTFYQYLNRAQASELAVLSPEEIESFIKKGKIELTERGENSYIHLDQLLKVRARRKGFLDNLTAIGQEEGWSVAEEGT